VRLRDPVEILYLALMYRWETSAPPDGHQGHLDGEPERNTQISRMAYLLRKIAAGTKERAYAMLADFTRRNDGESYISRNPSWMKQPYRLSEHWFFEGCTSLVQKQSFLEHLTKLGLSADFVACADAFVAGESVKKFFPTEEEEDEILRKIQERERLENA
jgi:hypothetical protein